MIALLPARRRRLALAGATAALTTLLVTGASPSAAVTAAAGSGTLNGTINYSIGYVPGGLAACYPSAQWSFPSGGATGNAAVVHLKGDFYAGGISVTGGATMSCDGGAFANGTATFNFQNATPLVSGDTLDCPGLTGPWIRTGAIATYVLFGSKCSVNSVNDGSAQVMGTGQWMPAGSSTPFTQNASSASVTTVWSVAAASGGAL
jgi:hypothetical protein